MTSGVKLLIETALICGYPKSLIVAIITLDEFDLIFKVFRRTHPTSINVNYQ